MTARTPRPTLAVAAPPAGAPAPRRSDVELLAALRRGEEAVAEDFYWRVKPVVVRTIRRLLGRLDQDCEDMTQLTMIQLIEALPRYRGDCPLDAWVSSVSAHVVYKQIRRRRLERTLFAQAPLDDEAIGWGAPRSSASTGPFVAREITRRIGEHLAGMHAGRAWAFLLHDVCGYSIEEMAEICRISTPAAQSRLSRGRRELHERIAADPVLRDWMEEGGRNEPASVR